MISFPVFLSNLKTNDLPSLIPFNVINASFAFPAGWSLKDSFETMPYFVFASSSPFKTFVNLFSPMTSVNSTTSFDKEDLDFGFLTCKSTFKSSAFFTSSGFFSYS